MRRDDAFLRIENHRLFGGQDSPDEVFPLASREVFPDAFDIGPRGKIFPDVSGPVSLRRRRSPRPPDAAGPKHEFRDIGRSQVRRNGVRQETRSLLFDLVPHDIRRIHSGTAFAKQRLVVRNIPELRERIHVKRPFLLRPFHPAPERGQKVVVLPRVDETGSIRRQSGPLHRDQLVRNVVEIGYPRRGGCFLLLAEPRKRIVERLHRLSHLIVPLRPAQRLFRGFLFRSGRREVAELRFGREGVDRRTVGFHRFGATPRVFEAPEPGQDFPRMSSKCRVVLQRFPHKLFVLSHDTPPVAVTSRREPALRRPPVP